MKEFWSILLYSVDFVQAFISSALPYVAGLSEKNVLQVWQYGAFLWPSNSLRHKLVHPKDRMPKHRVKNSLWAECSEECLDVYIAETKQGLHKCMAQHKKATLTGQTSARVAVVQVAERWPQSKDGQRWQMGWKNSKKGHLHPLWMISIEHRWWLTTPTISHLQSNSEIPSQVRQPLFTLCLRWPQ